MRAAAGNDPPLFWDAPRGGIQRSIQILILTFDLDVGLVDPIALIDRLQITVEDIYRLDLLGALKDPGSPLIVCGRCLGDTPEGQDQGIGATPSIVSLNAMIQVLYGSVSTRRVSSICPQVLATMRLVK